MISHHGGTETRRKLIHEELTEKIIGAAIEVHRILGPGLLESAYEECLCHELTIRNLQLERQVQLPVEYKGVRVDCGYRIDIIVADTVVLELKCVDRVLPIHEAQLITYLRLKKISVGLLINFHSEVLTRHRAEGSLAFLRVSVSPW